MEIGTVLHSERSRQAVVGRRTQREWREGQAGCDGVQGWTGGGGKTGVVRVRRTVRALDWSRNLFAYTLIRRPARPHLSAAHPPAAHHSGAGLSLVTSLLLNLKVSSALCLFFVLV